VQLAAAASAPKTTPIQSAAPSAKRTASSGGTYVVKKGDMLSVIAQTELGSAKRWREIAKLNPKVDPDRLLEGTRLVMPTGASQGPKVAQAGSGKRQATSSVRRVR
jgi:nucleoid-associated protein YgaU